MNMHTSQHLTLHIKVLFEIIIRPILNNNLSTFLTNKFVNF